MVELSTAETTAGACCASEQQATCCEASAKAECCDHDEVCGCDASKTTQPTEVMEASRRKLPDPGLPGLRDHQHVPVRVGKAYLLAGAGRAVLDAPGLDASCK